MQRSTKEREFRVILVGSVISKIFYVYRKRVSGIDKVVNLKDFSRPNKAIKCFKDLNRIQGLFKTTTKIQDLFKTVRTMLPKNPIPKQPS